MHALAESCEELRVRTGNTPSSEFLAGKFVMFGEDKIAPVYTSCHRGAFLFTSTRFILRYNDWIVLEIITQWTGKTFL
jgi:hypothetical protein